MRDPRLGIGEFSGSQCQKLLHRTVDSKPGKKRDTEVDHLNRLRDDQRSTPKPCQPMAKPAIDTLQSVGFILALVVLPNRQTLVMTHMAVRAVKCYLPVSQPLQELFQR